MSKGSPISPTGILESTEAASLAELERYAKCLADGRDTSLGEISVIRQRIRGLRDSLERAERILDAKEAETRNAFAIQLAQAREECLSHLRAVHAEAVAAGEGARVLR